MSIWRLCKSAYISKVVRRALTPYERFGVRPLHTDLLRNLDYTAVLLLLRGERVV